MKHRVAVVGEPERCIEAAVEREVQREKVLAAMGKRGRQAVGHGQRGVGSDDAMELFELIAVGVSPEEARLDRAQNGVDRDRRHERDRQRRSRDDQPSPRRRTRGAVLPPEPDPEAPPLRRAYHQPAQSRREVLVRNDELVGASAQVRVSERGQSDQQGAPTQQRQQAEGHEKQKQGLELVQLEGPGDRVERVEHNGAHELPHRASQVRVARKVRPIRRGGIWLERGDDHLHHENEVQSGRRARHGADPSVRVRPAEGEHVQPEGGDGDRRLFLAGCQENERHDEPDPPPRLVAVIRGQREWDHQRDGMEVEHGDVQQRRV